MEENPTRAAAAKASGTKTAGTSGRAKSSKTGTALKTGKTAKTGRTSSAAKKTSKTTDNGMRLTNAEKELVKNYRKCSALEKKLIAAVTEKAAGGIDVDNLLGVLKAFL